MLEPILDQITGKPLLCISGGIDSTVAAYALKLKNSDTRALMFNYGQANYGPTRRVVNRVSTETGVPVDHMQISGTFDDYSDDSSSDIISPYRASGGDFRPKRTMVALTVEAATYAAVNDCDILVLGLCESDLMESNLTEDSWDPRPFFGTVEAMIASGLDKTVKIIPMWAGRTKQEVATTIWNQIKDKWTMAGYPPITILPKDTWSCYYAGPRPCEDSCPGCKERADAGIPHY
jgi:7-cyano-7-deazaguanine synthase in queuosine biosynthesis